MDKRFRVTHVFTTGGVMEAVRGEAVCSGETGVCVQREGEEFSNAACPSSALSSAGLFGPNPLSVFVFVPASVCVCV